MRKFDLVSVDWDSVRLMQAGQFKQETFYLEELVRWTLQRGRVAGLLHLADDAVSRPSPEGDRLYSIVVRGCLAVGRQGQIIDIPDDPTLALRGTIEAHATLVPLYVGSSLVERAPEPHLHSSVDTGLLGCRGLRPSYQLSSDNSDETIDWVQIAQFEKTTTGLSPDRSFIPETMFLSSHAGQWRAQQELRTLARQALDLLVKHSSPAVQRYAAATALAGSLGPLAGVTDGNLSPRVYMGGVGGVLMAQRAQLLALPSPGLKIYQDTVDQLEDTLNYLETAEWSMGQAFLMARECLDRLLQLYPPLLAALEAAAPAPERRLLDHETVVAARDPRGVQDVSREDDPAAVETPRRTGGFMWRK
jgi:hypothetical protein